MTEAIDDTIEAAGRTFEIWDRVHDDLENGKRWDDIDNGFSPPYSNVAASYESWRAYMDQRMQHLLRDIVLTNDRP
jgi:hypothetical protein